MDYLPFINKFIDTEKFFIKMNEIDFVGQRKAEIMYKVILSTALVIAMIFSYITQKLSDGVYIMIGGLIIAILLTVPSWPYLNKAQLNWLTHKEEYKTLESKPKKD